MGETNDEDDERLEVDIYPLSCYYFGSKDAIPFKDHSLADRLQRMKFKFVPFLLFCRLLLLDVPLLIFHLTLFWFILHISYAAHGMRTCVEAVIMVSPFIVFFYGDVFFVKQC